jgi:two-component system, NtrC family, response regulator HydG
MRRRTRTEGRPTLARRPHPASARLITTAVKTPTASASAQAADTPEADAMGQQSLAMRCLMTLAARVAPLDATVLITGESGVGKERLARWLHDASRRARGPFIAINGGAFAETLLESELFGHARGAFTGALHDRPGLFEAAQGGTLFLDEVGEVSPTLQVKLLRIIQEREVRRLGETKVRPIDVRLIAATNRDLRQEVVQRRFRQDLYYRLRVIDLHVPPLRERAEELQALARVFLTQAAARLHRPVTAFAPAAWDQILHYGWPGNIRELEHAIERACVVAAGDRLELEDLPADVRHAAHARSSASSVPPLRLREREHILAVLARHHGDRRRAAEELQISLSTLKRKLRACGPLA